MFEGEEELTETISAFGSTDTAMKDAGFTDFAPAVSALRQMEQSSLEDKFASLSSVLGIQLENKSLDEFDEDQFTRLQRPRHPGYNASARVVFSR